MREKKNIDRLFQEEFKDFEVSPADSVWKNIENELMKKNKKRRIVPLWIRFGGAAAVFLLLLSTVFWYFNNDTTTLEQPEKIIITNTKIKDNKSDKKPTFIKENVITEKDDKTSTEENTIAKSELDNNRPKSKKNSTKNKNSDDKENMPNTNQQRIAISMNKDDMIEPQIKKPTNIDVINKNDLIKSEIIPDKKAVTFQEVDHSQKNGEGDIQKEIEKRNEKETVKKNNINNWSVGSTLAPIYYTSFGNGSPIDPGLSNNKKSGNSSVSYGLKLTYKLSDKLSLQSGVNKLELGYSTENVTTLISSSLLDGSNTNINTNVDGVSVAAVSTTTQSSETISLRSTIDVSGTLAQSLNYLEIPLEAKYSILQNKLRMNLVGGFSTYFLYDNQVSITSFGKKNILGEASNINSLNFSGNLGVDFDYNISKKLYINISPMFKYQFNTYSRNSGGFKPYYLGVYSGLNFRF